VEFRLALAGTELAVSTSAHSVAFSPDGNAVAYLAAGQGRRIIVVRRLDTDRAQVLPGSEGAADVQYSPDGGRMAFYNAGKLFLVGVDGTPPTELASIDSYRGIAWANANTVVYATPDTLWRIDAATRSKHVVTVADRHAKETDVNTPVGMPDGKTIAFVVLDQTGVTVARHLAFVGLDGANRVVTSVVGHAVGLRDGWLLYSDGKGISGVPFDLARRQPSGESRLLVDSTRAANAFYTSVGAAGDLAYVRGNSGQTISLLGLRGEELTALGEVTGVAYPAWSPDGRRLAYSAPGANVSGIWIYDAKAGTTARLATRVTASRSVWSPDGKRIAFINNQRENQPVDVIPADGSAAESVLVPAPPNSTIREAAFTPDGKSLVLTTSATLQAPRDIMLVALGAGGSQPKPLVATAADERQPVVSADGRWLAYMSNESGGDEVYVRPMNAPGGAAVLSKGGGSMPRWTRDGHVIYVDASGSFRRVELTTVGGLPAAGKRDSLFSPRLMRQDLHQNYDIAPDGRFAVVRNASAGADIVVVTNWWATMRAKLGGR
jgi:Tol biopolymer transport system component